MSNNWTNFTESEKEYPEDIVNKKITGFINATKGLAEMNVVQLSNSERITSTIRTDFIFALYLTSPKVNGYRFKIMNFGYNITLDPVTISVASGIFSEIYSNDIFEFNSELNINNENFLSELDKIFNSKAFIELVKGLMKVANKGIDTNGW